MSKRKKILPKAPTEVEKLQTERADLQSKLDGPDYRLGVTTRAAAVARLLEIKRRLNAIYSAGQ